MNIERDIHPLTDFKRDTTRFIQQLKETGEPLVLTINGRPEIVVINAHAYQELLDQKEHLETIAGIRRGLEDARQGKVRPAREYFAEFMETNGIKADEE